jgi:tRNA (guanine37-N1)-methyltransferase
LSSGVDVVGDIAILKLPGIGVADKEKVAKTIMEQTKTVKCVFEQEGGIEGEFRLRNLRHIGGDDRTVTMHRENGCRLKVDVARCYFSPRLSTERLRIADQSGHGETVLNMFAGVGPFSVLIAKRQRAKVLSCELSEVACEYHRENNRLNKVEDLVDVLNADAMDLPKLTRRKFDRILMPHPSQSHRFLQTAVMMAKKGATIHYYRHVLGRDEGDAAASLRSELDGALPARSSYTVRRVREVGPRWIEMAADVELP